MEKTKIWFQIVRSEVVGKCDEKGNITFFEKKDIKELYNEKAKRDYKDMSRMCTNMSIFE